MRGLTVVGVTGGEKAPTDEWVARMGARYAYGIDPWYTWDYRFNLFVYPAAILVDPSGIVVWTGHPSALPEDLLRKTLKGALREPLHDWPDAVADVKEAVLVRDYASARELASHHASSRPVLDRYVQAVEQLAELDMKAVRRSVASGDLWAAQQLGLTIVDGMRGFPQEPELRRTLAALEANEAERSLVEAQAALISLWYEALWDHRDVDACIERVTALAEAHPDTAVSREAVYLTRFLRWMREGLPAEYVHDTQDGGTSDGDG